MFNRKFCAQSKGSRVVSIRLPDGRLERFDVKTLLECMTWMEQGAGHFFDVQYVAKAGTRSTKSFQMSMMGK